MRGGFGGEPVEFRFPWNLSRLFRLSLWFLFVSAHRNPALSHGVQGVAVDWHGSRRSSF